MYRAGNVHTETSRRVYLETEPDRNRRSWRVIEKHPRRFLLFTALSAEKNTARDDRRMIYLVS